MESGPSSVELRTALGIMLAFYADANADVKLKFLGLA